MAVGHVTGIGAHFAALTDPRADPGPGHLLVDIVTIALCAVLCGADGRVAVETFGRAKAAWLRTFLALPSGIPAHDTFGRVFARRDPGEFRRCFLAWVQAVAPDTAGHRPEGTRALDGKTLRRSHDRANGQAALHMVRAWASDSGLVLGQLAVDEKSDASTAIPALLRLLDVTGAPTDHDHWATVEKDHGRIETRRHRVLRDPETIAYLNQGDAWAGSRAIGLVERRRRIGEALSSETHDYRLSGADDAATFGRAIRSHRGIEHRVHRVLDTIFREDERRVRVGAGAANLAVPRHFARNPLRQERTARGSLATKRFRAALDDACLLTLLAGFHR